MAATLITTLAEHEAQARESARRYDAIYGQGDYHQPPAGPVRDADLKALRDLLCG